MMSTATPRYWQMLLISILADNADDDDNDNSDTPTPQQDDDGLSRRSRRA